KTRCGGNRYTIPDIARRNKDECGEYGGLVWKEGQQRLRLLSWVIVGFLRGRALLDKPAVAHSSSAWVQKGYSRRQAGPTWQAYPSRARIRGSISILCLSSLSCHYFPNRVRL